MHYSSSRLTSATHNIQMEVDDRDRAAAALAQVHALEEQERTRRVSEVEEEERMESDVSRAVTGM